MSFIFIMVLRTRKRLTSKDVVAVKGLNLYQSMFSQVEKMDERRLSKEIYGADLDGK
jgi:uncharacterized protein YcgL (UPF0745 family)